MLINDTYSTAVTASISLVFVVFVGTLLFHLHQESKKNSLNYRKVKEMLYNIVSVKETKCDSPDKEDNILIPEQGSSTSYVDLRESLIDSTL